METTSRQYWKWCVTGNREGDSRTVQIILGRFVISRFPVKRQPPEKWGNSRLSPLRRYSCFSNSTYHGVSALGKALFWENLQSTWYDSIYSLFKEFINLYTFTDFLPMKCDACEQVFWWVTSILQVRQILQLKLAFFQQGSRQIWSTQVPVFIQKRHPSTCLPFM